MSERLDPVDCADLKAKIARLTSDYEALIAGRKSRVLVDQNGERIEFNAGNARTLSTYLVSLNSQYAAGCGLKRQPVSRPMKPYF